MYPNNAITVFRHLNLFSGSTTTKIVDNLDTKTIFSFALDSSYSINGNFLSDVRLFCGSNELWRTPYPATTTSLFSVQREISYVCHDYIAFVRNDGAIPFPSYKANLTYSLTYVPQDIAQSTTTALQSYEFFSGVNSLTFYIVLIFGVFLAHLIFQIVLDIFKKQ